MALPLPPGLTHSEVAFLAEMEMVTVVPRQRLDSIELLSGKTPPLRPPRREQLPLWLALLLKKQRRANIVPPPWLHPTSLQDIIHKETKEDPAAFSPPPPPASSYRADVGRPGMVRRNDNGLDMASPPFRNSCTADALPGYLPYHWLEVAEALLAHAGDDMGAPAGEVRSLLRDLVEVRAAKMRSSTSALEGFGGGLMSLRGVGAMELAETRGFVLGVVDGVRRIGAAAEANRREEEEEGGFRNDREEEESDDDMGI
ncbi:GINS complex protein-domain-containing protein [Diplogelasinospora grovesii]|uniref:DNA replication complex GINS protein PSF2 n=1 Tax=Diplogelasinospora grovesii TaxID=303347 RepID=A0AAN6S527_9PEZI|nr:GINS complex protein-domain-containing protein [Diplogelasinospora grovesii]